MDKEVPALLKEARVKFFTIENGQQVYEYTFFLCINYDIYIYIILYVNCFVPVDTGFARKKSEYFFGRR